MMDIIRISELEIYAYHGVYVEEKEKKRFKSDKRRIHKSDL